MCSQSAGGGASPAIRLPRRQQHRVLTGSGRRTDSLFGDGSSFEAEPSAVRSVHHDPPVAFFPCVRGHVTWVASRIAPFLTLRRERMSRHFIRATRAYGRSVRRYRGLSATVRSFPATQTAEVLRSFFFLFLCGGDQCSRARRVTLPGSPPVTPPPPVARLSARTRVGVFMALKRR